MNVTEKTLASLISRLNAARSAVYLSAQVLDHGDTDLELQATTTLKRAFRSMDRVYDDLLSMRLEVGRSERQAADTSRDPE